MRALPTNQRDVPDFLPDRIDWLSLDDRQKAPTTVAHASSVAQGSFGDSPSASVSTSGAMAGALASGTANGAALTMSAMLAPAAPAAATPSIAKPAPFRDPDGATADPRLLLQIDAYMADDQIAALMAAYGAQGIPATGLMARTQRDIYGATRYEQMGSLMNAKQAVRDLYMAAFNAAEASSNFTREVPRMHLGYDDNGNYGNFQVVDRSRDDGVRPLVFDHVFDVAAFTDWYERQPGLANQAFRDFYGAAHATVTEAESGETQLSGVTFDNADYGVNLFTRKMGGGKLIALDLNKETDLYDRTAIVFDPECGCFGTSYENLQDNDSGWVETAFTIAAIVAVAVATSGAATALASSLELASTATVAGVSTVTYTTTGAMLVGGAVGAATSIASGAISGHFSWGEVLRSAIAAAVTAGATNGLQGAQAIATRTVAQGGVQAALGGSFKDGAVNGLVASLAQEFGRTLEDSIQAAVKAETLAPSEVFAARTSAKLLTSCIKILSNPDHPMYALASDFVSQMAPQLNLASPRVESTALDDEGNVMPGVVDPSASQAEQARQLTERLRDQGVEAAEAGRIADRALSPPTGTAANAGANNVDIALPAQPAPVAKTSPGDITPTSLATPPQIGTGLYLYPAFDDDGNLTPEVIETNATQEARQAKLVESLMQQGISREMAGSVARNAYEAADKAQVAELARQVVSDAYAAARNGKPGETVEAPAFRVEVSGLPSVDEYNAAQVQRAYENGSNLNPTNANAARLELQARGGGVSADELATRFGRGVLGGIKGLVIEPILQVGDLATAAAAVSYNELFRAKDDPMWLPDLHSGLADASANGMPQWKLLLQSNPLTGLAVTSYDLTTAGLGQDWGAIAEGAGALAVGGLIGRYANYRLPSILELEIATSSSIRPPPTPSEYQWRGQEWMHSSSDLAGVERASPELLNEVQQRRAVTIAEPGSDAERFLNYRAAEAAAFGEEDILVRPDPSKAALLEEFLHGTQQRLGIIDKIGRAEAESHVKDFMIRHKDLLGLGAEDVRRLQTLKDMGL